jgi:hypothetical protein
MPASKSATLMIVATGRPQHELAIAVSLLLMEH